MLAKLRVHITACMTSAFVCTCKIYQLWSCIINDGLLLGHRQLYQGIFWDGYNRVKTFKEMQDTFLRPCSEGGSAL